ncbi:MAG: hypothetical protein ACTSUE_17355 [Promethearchaeota archaeon]
MPSKKTVISKESLAKKAPARKRPAKSLRGVSKKKQVSSKVKKNKVSKKRAGKSVPAKKAPKSAAKSKVKSLPIESVEKKKRRKLPGEAATMKMVALQTKSGKQRQEVENMAKFNRGVYTCVRNINPEMRVGRDGASLIEQAGNEFARNIVSTAMAIALAAAPSGKKKSSIRKLEAKHVLAALETNPDYLAKITPHPPMVVV